LIRPLYKRRSAGLRAGHATLTQTSPKGIRERDGKGGKTRVVRLSRETWAGLEALRIEKLSATTGVFPMSAGNA
jgi:hypothetical protein